MKNLNEAIINLINEDVVNGKKAIHGELYNRIGNMLEEKLVEFAPTIFNEQAKKPLSPKQKKHMDKDGDNDIDESDLLALRNEDVDDNENIISEEFNILAEELETLVNEIEEELGEELNESDIEDLADMLLESLEEDPDEEEDFEDEEDFEEDFEDEDEE